MRRSVRWHYRHEHVIGESTNICIAIAMAMIAAVIVAVVVVVMQHGYDQTSDTYGRVNLFAAPQTLKVDALASTCTCRLMVASLCLLFTFRPAIKQTPKAQQQPRRGDFACDSSTKPQLNSSGWHLLCCGKE